MGFTMIFWWIEVFFVGCHSVWVGFHRHSNWSWECHQPNLFISKNFTLVVLSVFGERRLGLERCNPLELSDCGVKLLGDYHYNLAYDDDYYYCYYYHYYFQLLVFLLPLVLLLSLVSLSLLSSLLLWTDDCDVSHQLLLCARTFPGQFGFSPLKWGLFWIVYFVFFWWTDVGPRGRQQDSGMILSFHFVLSRNSKSKPRRDLPGDTFSVSSGHIDSMFGSLFFFVSLCFFGRSMFCQCLALANPWSRWKKTKRRNRAQLNNMLLLLAPPLETTR